MRKILAILIICFLAFGLLFGCTIDTNVTGTETGDTLTPPSLPDDSTSVTGTGTSGTTIPMPPALPE